MGNKHTPFMNNYGLYTNKLFYMPFDHPIMNTPPIANKPTARALHTILSRNEPFFLLSYFIKIFKERLLRTSTSIY